MFNDIQQRSYDWLRRDLRSVPGLGITHMRTYRNVVDILSSAGRRMCCRTDDCSTLFITSFGGVRMDIDKKELKYRTYRLEIWKALLATLTPIILIILTFVVNNAIQKSGSLLKREEEIASQISRQKRDIYADLGKKLNIIYIYVQDIGDYSSYTPQKILEFKRQSDRQFFSYFPYWSCETEINYKKFMNTAFKMYNASGESAKIRSYRHEKEKAYENNNKEWNDQWNDYFTESRYKNTDVIYYNLIQSILKDTANAELRKVSTECNSIKE